VGLLEMSLRWRNGIEQAFTALSPRPIAGEEEDQSYLHMNPQHQFLRMRIQKYLLVHPRGNPIVAAAIPSYKTGLKRQNPLSMTARIPFVASTPVKRIPEREWITVKE